MRKEEDHFTFWKGVWEIKLILKKKIDFNSFNNLISIHKFVEKKL